MTLLLFGGCENKKLGSSREKQDEYVQKIGEALSSDNISVISSTIDYIDNISNRDSFASIYYDKARLLYKLKKFDEALKTLDNNKKTVFNKYTKAALLMRLKRNDEAITMLTELKKEYLNELSTYENNDLKRGSSIQAIFGLILLMDQDYEFEISELINANMITEKEGDNLKKHNLTKEFILQSLWPE
jgi:tetratricopeptide (TPR) repeat protein